MSLWMFSQRSLISLITPLVYLLDIMQFIAGTAYRFIIIYYKYYIISTALVCYH